MIKSMSSVVLFPAPFGPSIPRISPSRASRFKWSTARFCPSMLKYPIYDPREIEADGNFVGNEQIARYRLIGTKPEDHIKHIEEYVKLGFQHVYVLSSGPDEVKTLRMYGKHVLPYLHSTYEKG